MTLNSEHTASVVHKGHKEQENMTKLRQTGIILTNQCCIAATDLCGVKIYGM